MFSGAGGSLLTAPRVRLAVFPFIVVLLTAIASAPALADKRVALVIGNSAYQNVTALDNPKNDARLMADTLRSLGFSLVGDGAQLDLDKRGIDRAVQAFGAQLQGVDVALFYYAGHGVQVSGANYLVPVDANPVRQSDVDFQMLDANVILRQMAESGTKLNLVILDACRNNPFGGRGLRGGTRGLAQMQAAEGTLISFATQPGNVAQDGADGDSPFTKALAQTIRKPGLDVFRTFNEVGVAVANATGGTQQPWLSLSPIKGDFYFVGPPEASVAPVVATPGPSEAERAWAMIKDTTSVTVLEAFAAQFSNTVYAALARAGIDELKKNQVAVVAPPLNPKFSSRVPQDKGAAVAQRVVVYEEDPNDPQGRRFVGSAIWRTETVSPGPGLAPELAVRADIEIPERRMTVTWSLRRNTDKALPASHIIEIMFKLPADFPGGGVANVPGILMKESEQARGTPLAGLAVKVTNGFFLIGLSAVDTDLQRNVQLLKERPWFDIPVVYTNGGRAILAMEKGPPGDRAFAALEK